MFEEKERGLDGVHWKWFYRIWGKQMPFACEDNYEIADGY